MSDTLLALRLGHDADVVLARRRARQVAARLGFETQDQARIATAVSELARNAVRYARGGRVAFRLEGTTAPQTLVVEVRDDGPGLADSGAASDGVAWVGNGAGLGLDGVRRLMDRFEVASTPGGTTVTLAKRLPRGAGVVAPAVLAGLDALGHERPEDLVEEVQQQNQELLAALAELEGRQQELVALNRELEDTNRGVVALYAELDERADHLRRADEVKSRFLSSMGHEFRTPVNAIHALAGLLLDRVDGELTAEQQRQVEYIRAAASSLGDLVNDLLDLTKAEAGKTEVHPVEFRVEEVFGSLRGMLRPLLVGEAVRLVFDEPEGLPPLCTDEAKVSQILRNFVSNAIKFTERGEVRVSARAVPGADAVAFSVSDTGIGIAPEDHARIFEEFTQLDSPVQRRVKGTGLGLPLCRRLVELLGGEIRVESALGQGSTFTALVPRVYAAPLPALPVWRLDPGRLPVLVVAGETDEALHADAARAGFQLLAARSMREAHEALRVVRPRAIVLDAAFLGDDAREFAAMVRRRADTRDVPLVVVAAEDGEEAALALAPDACCRKRVDGGTLLALLGSVAEPSIRPRRILVVDDEEVARYLLRQQLAAPAHEVLEASSGEEAIRRVRIDPPDVVCLDLRMPGMSGFEVIRRLKADPATRGVPIVVISSYELTAAERVAIDGLTAGILRKELATRERTLALIDAAVTGVAHDA